MTREDLINVKDKIANKLDDKTREEFMGLYDIVASPDFGGMTNDEMKRLLGSKTLDEICWNKYMYLREQAKSLKNVVIVGKSGGYYVVLGYTPDDMVHAISEDGDTYNLESDQYKVVSGIHHEKFMDAMIEMHSYAVERNKQMLNEREAKAKTKTKTNASVHGKKDSNSEREKHVECLIFGGF